MLSQKAYLFGAQLSYTDYATNHYQEFKLVENVTTKTSTTYNQVSQGADVTHLWDDAERTGLDDFMKWLIDEQQGITPVSTDQTPLRFTTNLSQISETGVSTIEAWVLIKNERNENEWTSYNSISDITSTINSPGTYFIKLTYNFASYTNNAGAIDASNDGKHFSQYFYFTIDKTAPSFTMQARGDYNEENEDYDWEQLLSKEYTNAEEVKLTYADFANPFHSAVTFEYERYDFINRSTSSGVITFNESGEYIFSQEGNYTIKVYYGKQGTAEDPSTSSFTIDRQNIQDLAAYSVYTSGANNDYRI